LPSSSTAAISDPHRRHTSFHILHCRCGPCLGQSVVRCLPLAPEQARRSKEALLVKLIACSWGGVWVWPSEFGQRCEGLPSAAGRCSHCLPDAEGVVAPWPSCLVF
jgi:hypothetical protein